MTTPTLDASTLQALQDRLDVEQVLLPVLGGGRLVRQGGAAQLSSPTTSRAHYGNSDPVMAATRSTDWIEGATASVIWQHHLAQRLHGRTSTATPPGPSPT